MCRLSNSDFAYANVRDTHLSNDSADRSVSGMHRSIRRMLGKIRHPRFDAPTQSYANIGEEEIARADTRRKSLFLPILIRAQVQIDVRISCLESVEAKHLLK